MLKMDNNNKRLWRRKDGHVLHKALLCTGELSQKLRGALTVEYFAIFFLSFFLLNVLLFFIYIFFLVKACGFDWLAAIIFFIYFYMLFLKTEAI